MHIHFVCTGNVYRSRLAEAYLNSKQFSLLTTSSSGSEAADNTCGPVCWYTQRIIEACHLVPYMSVYWKQTSSESFVNVDYVVFMEERHYLFAVESCGFTNTNFEIWHVPDLDELRTLEVAETVEAVRMSEKTFALIKSKVDDLGKRLRLE
jgi:protein-tyrosine-phosphatase